MLSNWEMFAIALLWAWLIRYVAGAIYGIYLMYKKHPSTWNFVDQLFVGLPFWIGYYIGSIIKKAVKWKRIEKEFLKITEEEEKYER